MQHINNLLAGAAESGDATILSQDAAQSAVGTLSNAVSVSNRDPKISPRPFPTVNPTRPPSPSFSF
jgi:hypothetical protein